jgi:haloacetate dehalogenase
MARDQVELMRQLGFERFSVCGHDRGARCAYRLALDQPGRVEKLALLDIVPTADAFRLADSRFALASWHWFFLAQPDGLAERMIGADPDAFYFSQRYQARELFAPEALEDYLRCARRPETIHAMCEDYRAGATIDVELDEADRGTKRIECPVLVLWGGRGKLGELYDDVLEIWRGWAGDVRGRAHDCGHFVAEEAPDETRDEWVSARIELDFRSEVRLSDVEVIARASIERIGTSSITTAVVLELPDGTVALEGRAVLVAWDLQTRRSRPLTAAERQALAELKS